MRILCINLGFGGGCVFYANSILEDLSIAKDVWINKYCEEPFSGAISRLRMGKGLFAMLWQSALLLPIYLIKTLFTGCRYRCLVVFGPSNWDLAFIMLFRILRKKTYYVVHDGIMHVGEEKKAHQWMLYQCMRRSTNLIFLSSYVKRKVEQDFGIIKPHVIIPHGVVRYSSVNQQLVDLPLLPTFTLIGRISYYKGIALLAEAIPLLDFSKIKQIVIAGSISHSVEIPKDSNKIHIDNRWLSTNDFDTYVKNSDFLLMPYLEATQSGIAAVSIGYAKPAIVTRVGAMQEQFSEEGAYFMDEISAPCLANAIMASCGDNVKYRAVQRNLIRLSEKYSWKELADKLNMYIENDLG